MSKNRKSMPLYRLALCSFLVALSIVCGKFLKIPVGDVLRFSFENLPILFAGLVFGPVEGVLVGVVADLLGCVLYGYAVNPLVTAGAVCIGLLAGVGGITLRRLPLVWQVVLTTTAAHLVGSVVVKTLGLAQYYSMPLLPLMGWRLLNYVIVGIAEAFALYLLLRHKGIQCLTKGG
ncbi:MAG: folate family ECF transporter S component [Clostridia bacterium]|nr:folate family ECF transporter S component [Clostridia bacterium]